MGTWSAAILGNDTTCEVHERFIELYNSGEEPADIAQTVLKEQKENLIYDKTNVWFGLALACWECKVLKPEIYTTVKKIIEQGEDLEYCKELDADDQFLKERKKTLDVFLKKISSEKPKARVIVKPPLQIPSAYLPGMCMAYKNKEGFYVGIYLHESEHFRNRGEMKLCFLDIESSELPAIDHFKNGKLYGLEKLGEKWGDREYCGNVVGINYEKNSKDDFFKSISQIFRIVGILTPPDTYLWINNYRGGFMNRAYADDMIELIEANRAETKVKYLLSDLTLGELLNKVGQKI